VVIQLGLSLSHSQAGRGGTVEGRDAIADPAAVEAVRGELSDRRVHSVLRVEHARRDPRLYEPAHARVRVKIMGLIIISTD
jgi:hypothetical protein